IASSPRFGGIENGFVAQIVWIHCKYISMTNISYIQEIYKDLYLITVHYSLTSASYLDRWPLTLTDIKTEAPSALTQSGDSQHALGVRVCAHGTDGMRDSGLFGQEAA